MALDVAINTFPGVGLVPIYGPFKCLPVQLPASVAYPAGQVLGELTATPGTYKAYASGNLDGSQVPKLILQYPTATDAAGNCYLGTTAVPGLGVASRPSAPAYERGIFKTTDLTGWDANARTVMAAHLVSGTDANGIVDIG